MSGSGISAEQEQAGKESPALTGGVSELKDLETIAHYDDGSKVYLDMYTGGAHPKGAWAELDLRFVSPEGVETVRRYAEIERPKMPVARQPAELATVPQEARPASVEPSAGEGT